MRKWRQRLEGCLDKPRDTKDHRQPPETGRGKKGFLPRALGESILTLRSWTSSLQNCATIGVCCFKPPRLWYLVMEILGNRYTVCSCMFDVAVGLVGGVGKVMGWESLAVWELEIEPERFLKASWNSGGGESYLETFWACFCVVSCTKRLRRPC